MMAIRVGIVKTLLSLRTQPVYVHNLSTYTTKGVDGLHSCLILQTKW